MSYLWWQSPKQARLSKNTHTSLSTMEMYGMWFLESKQQSSKRVKKIRIGYQHLGRTMDIDRIADIMEGKTIEDVQVVYGEDTMVIFLSDGSSIEIVIDSIYADIPELDD